ncbi:MAG TPA: hypothetical protein VNL98_03120 [Gemmatimonadales bacterium]|nr:hypothetical protein [Gemmatimonadales bacterium]
MRKAHSGYRCAVLAACASVIWARSVAAQSPEPAPAYAVSAGFGNNYGWLGGAVEVYVVRGRLSVFAGGGVIPSGLSDFQSTSGRAAGVRYYWPLGAGRKLLFADLSVSLLLLKQAAMVGAPVVHDYGPGLSAGYAFIARSGLTFSVSLGVGEGDVETVPILSIGAGWTWRR